MSQSGFTMRGLAERLSRNLTAWILLGMIAGVLAGQVLHTQFEAATIKESVAPWLKLLSDIFLHLIQDDAQTSKEEKSEGKKRRFSFGRKKKETDGGEEE